jgi:predicted dienelactone hydrolase
VWLLVGGALRLQAAQRADVYRSDGPYLAAEARDFSITDHSRGLDVPVRVRFPVGDGPFPLIVFSHGLGANREAFESVSQH